MPSDEEEVAPPPVEQAAAAAAAEEVKTPEKKRRGSKRKGEGEEEGSSEKKSGGRRRSRTAEERPVERPSRERKAVERYSELSSPRKSPKALSIPQGSGTKLKDIPNVSYKISKRKTDENIQALHALLFGRKSTSHFLKRNILQFSGFVWSENEEKLRSKFKEKLDKFHKDKLLDFCEMLDIPNVKTIRKEDILAKIIEFLESPHVTRDIILSEQGEKRKGRRKTKRIRRTSDEDAKRKEKTPETGSKKRRTSSAKAAEEEEGDGGSIETEDASSDKVEEDVSEEESDHAKSQDNEEDEPEEPVSSKKESGRKKTVQVAVEKALPIKRGSAKSVSKGTSLSSEDEPDLAAANRKELSNEPTKRDSKSISKKKASSSGNDSIKKNKRAPENLQRKNVSVDDSDSSSPSTVNSKKSGRRKRQSSDGPAVKGKKGGMDQAAKSGSKGSTKERGKGKVTAGAKKGPNRDQLRSVISTLLKEVDFNTATLADIIKQAGSHFKVDLMDRKAEIRSIIEDVINSMSDAEEDEGDDAEAGEGDKDVDAMDAERENTQDESDGNDDD